MVMKELKPQEQNDAKDKVLAVIDSCITCNHFTNAFSFIELYLKQTNDINEYKELVSILNNKKTELNCHD